MPRSSTRMLDAVVAAARFERSVQRARYLRVACGQGRWGGCAPDDGARLALAAARELRRRMPSRG